MNATLALEKKKIIENPNILIYGKYLDIKIKDPIGNTEAIQPLDAAYSQLRFLELDESIKKEGKPRRIIAVKARQVYVTTIVQAENFSFTSQKEGINSLILADCDDGANYIFEMSKLFHERMLQKYPHLTPQKKRSNARELVFGDIHSQIIIDTARNLAAGRKFTFQRVHLSEFAFFNKPRELMQGINASVPKTENTLIVIETTSNGYGGYYYNEVMKAKDKKTDWRIYFVGFQECPDYIKPVTKKEIIFIEKTITPEEEALIKNYNCLWNQLWWRRYTIINDCGGRNMSNDPNLFQPNEKDKNSMNTFHQEYPAYLEQSFIASGACRFETSILQEWMDTAPKLAEKNEQLIPTKNYLQGYFIIDDKGYIEFIQQTDGPWKIFYYPEYVIDYAFGCDVSEGIETEESTGDYDYSTIFIFRRDTLEQVAEYRAYIEPDLLAFECFKSLHFYNSPMAGIEANKDGQTTLKFLREVYGYTNIYVRDIIEEEKQHRRTKKLGWLTTGGRHKGTRHVMINDLAEFIRNEEGRFYSKDTIGECLSFVRKPDGRVEHNIGCHDDLVFAPGIALQMHFLTPRTEAWKQRKRLKIAYK